MSILRWLMAQALQEASKKGMRESLQQALLQAREQAAEPPPPLAPIVLVFALREEAVGVLDRMQDARSYTRPLTGPAAEAAAAADEVAPSVRETHGRFAGRAITVLETGAGAEAAGRAVAEYLARETPQWILSTGFAGALVDGLGRGGFLLAEQVRRASEEPLAVDLFLDRNSIAGLKNVHLGDLVTVDKVVRTTADKRRLAEATGAVACDMETWAVLEAVRRAPLELDAATGRMTAPRRLAVRIISDDVDDELPPEMEVLVQQKTMAARLGAAAGAMFRRPGVVKDLLHFQGESLKLADRLARFLEGIVPQLTLAAIAARETE